LCQSIDLVCLTSCSWIASSLSFVSVAAVDSFTGECVGSCVDESSMPPSRLSSALRSLGLIIVVTAQSHPFHIIHPIVPLPETAEKGDDNDVILWPGRAMSRRPRHSWPARLHRPAGYVPKSRPAARPRVTPLRLTGTCSFIAASLRPLVGRLAGSGRQAGCLHFAVLATKRTDTWDLALPVARPHSPLACVWPRCLTAQLMPGPPILWPAGKGVGM